MRCIYLDNNATTQPDPQVVAAAMHLYDTLWANPSSVHRFGQEVRHRVELARASVAKLLGCLDRELVFTSGGTEANNLALNSFLSQAPGEQNHKVIITTRIEHSSVSEPVEALAGRGSCAVYLPVDRVGLVDPASLRDALQEHAGPGHNTLVSIQWANNETGGIQPINRLAEVCTELRNGEGKPRLLFHVDAVQAVGKLPIYLAEIPVDLLSLSAHKFHGPKGVGALYIRRGVRVTPALRGGPQERERRGGTENVPGIVGMGVAADLAGNFLANPGAVSVIGSLRDRFEHSVTKAIPMTVVNCCSGGADTRLWNTSNLGFPRLESEAILLALSERGVCASAGAACSSGSLEPSPVLLAMGIPEAVAHGSVRFSLSRVTTGEEIDQAAKIVIEVVQKLSKTLPLGV